MYTAAFGVKYIVVNMEFEFFGDECQLIDEFSINDDGSGVIPSCKAGKTTSCKLPISSTQKTPPAPKANRRRYTARTKLPTDALLQTRLKKWKGMFPWLQQRTALIDASVERIRLPCTI